MNRDDFHQSGQPGHPAGPQPEAIPSGPPPEPPLPAEVVRRPVRRRVWLPLALFLATCLSTLVVGGVDGALFLGYHEWQARGPWLGILPGIVTAVTYCYHHMLEEGWKYALPLMTILVCHEAGHFLQARRYGVPASFPFFIPMPIPPLGTLGAVIVMDPRIANRRALFDIGITGPLAGLVPTLVFCVVGLHFSTIDKGTDVFGDPWLFRQIAVWLKEPITEGQVIHATPMAFAGWVGLLITSLNLLPIGQLDGGHILYGLLRKKAHKVATLVLLSAIVAVAWFHLWNWTLMLFLLVMMGPLHPPTANDHVPLGPVRTVLGWLTLAFILIGFTPTPFLFGQ